MDDTTVDEHPARLFCTGCGARHVPGASFCAGCGAPLSEPLRVRSRGEGEVAPGTTVEHGTPNGVPSSQVPVTITITPAQLGVLAPGAGLIGGFLVGQYLANQVFVSLPLALVGGFIGYAISLRHPGSTFDQALRDAWANVMTRARALVGPALSSGAASRHEAVAVAVAAPVYTGLPTTPTVAPARTQAPVPVVASSSRPAPAPSPSATASGSSVANALRGVAAVAVIGALLLPWIGVSAFYSNNGGAYSLNGLGSGSWSAQVSGFSASGSTPGLDQFELGLPSQAQTLIDAFRLLPIVAAIASVGVLLLVAAAWNGKYRGRGLGLIGTLAGIVAIAASGAWFYAVSAINNQVGTGGFTVSLVSVGPGIGLTFLAGLVLPLCALFGRARPSAAAVVSVSAAQPQPV